MVDELVAWYERHRTELAERHIDVTLTRSPEDGRDKASAWLRVERGTDRGEIIVWDSGESELWGPIREQEIPGTDPRAEHRQLESRDDLDAAMQRLLTVFE